MRRIVACVAALVVAATLVTGCDRIGGGSSPHANGNGNGNGQAPLADIATTSATKGGCDQVGPLTSGELPQLDASDYTTVDNPCIPAVDIISQVLDGIPSKQQDEQVTENVSLLRDGLGRFVNQLSQINAVASCAYKTDRLAVRIYHSTQNKWAVGAVAVIRGKLGAIAETLACYLIGQIPIIGPLLQGVTTQAPDSPDYCFSSIGDKKDGQEYTIVWISDSHLLCQTFGDRMVPGDGTLIAVHANPDIALRSGPSRSETLIRRVPDGTIGRLKCYAEGETVKGNDLWVRVDILGITGFIAKAYLTTGDEVTGVTLTQTPDSNCQA